MNLAAGGGNGGGNGGSGAGPDSNVNEVPELPFAALFYMLKSAMSVPIYIGEATI